MFVCMCSLCGRLYLASHLVTAGIDFRTAHDPRWIKRYRLLVRIEFLKGRGIKRKILHIKYGLATGEGTNLCMFFRALKRMCALKECSQEGSCVFQPWRYFSAHFVSGEGSLSCFNPPEGQLSVFFPPKGAL